MFLEEVKKGNVYACRQFFILVIAVTKNTIKYKFFERINYVYILRGKKQSKPPVEPISVTATHNNFLTSVKRNNLILCNIFSGKKPVYVS